MNHSPAQVALADVAWLTALARSLVRDEQQADDLVQDTWMSVHRSSPSRGGVTRALLGTVLRNFHLRSLRARRRRAHREEAVSRREALASTAELVEQAELRRKLAECLLSLEDPFRTTLMRVAFENCTPAQIAAHEGVSESAIRHRLRKARALFRAKLERDYDGDWSAWRSALLPFASLPFPPMSGSPAPLPATPGSAEAAGLSTLGTLGGIVTTHGLAAVGLVIAAGTLLFSYCDLGGGDIRIAATDPMESAPPRLVLASTAGSQSPRNEVPVERSVQNTPSPPEEPPESQKQEDPALAGFLRRYEALKSQFSELQTSSTGSAQGWMVFGYSGKRNELFLRLQAEAIVLLYESRRIAIQDPDRLRDLILLARAIDVFHLVEPDFTERVREQNRRLVGPRGLIAGVGSPINKIRSLAVAAKMEAEFVETIRPAVVRTVERLLDPPVRKWGMTSSNLLRTAQAVDLREVLPLALRIATAGKDMPRVSPRFRAKAMFLVGKYGSTKDIDSLRGWLGDATVVWKGYSWNGKPMQTRLGDIALAAMVHLSGGDLAVYGFRFPEIKNPKFLDAPTCGWGFFGDELRQQAILRWRRFGI